MTKVSDPAGSVTIDPRPDGQPASPPASPTLGATPPPTSTTPKGELASIIPPSPLRPTTITYDSLSRVESVTDGKGQRRTYEYDLFDRPRKITFHDGSSTTFTYDDNGNVETRTDVAGSRRASTPRAGYTTSRCATTTRGSAGGRSRIRSIRRGTFGEGNRYVYVGGNPVNLTDALGLLGINLPSLGQVWEVTKCVAAIGAVGLGALKVYRAVRAAGSIKEAGEDSGIRGQ